MDPREEAEDLKKNPLPDCSTCDHCIRPEVECELMNGGQPCDYTPDEDHDESRPQIEQAYRVHELIAEYQEKIQALQRRYDGLLEMIVAAGKDREGEYSLIDKKRTVRVPDPVKFKDGFPVAYEKIKRELIDSEMKKLDDLAVRDLQTIPVKRAEELIGKDPLSKISDLKIYHNYSIVRTEAR